MSGEPISPDYIRKEGKAGRIGNRLMAVVAEGKRGRIYLSPSACNGIRKTQRGTRVATRRSDFWKQPILGSKSLRNGAVRSAIYRSPAGSADYVHGPLTTRRQHCKADAISAGMPDDNRTLDEGDLGASAYADAVVIYLAMAISKTADSNNSLCPWEPVAQCSRQLFGRQAIPMLRDFAEANPLHDSSCGLVTNIEVSLRAFHCFPAV